MDRATYTFLQIPFEQGTDEITISREALRAEWLDFTHRVIQTLGPMTGNTSALNLLQRVRAEFDVRTIPNTFDWTSQTLRPIGPTAKEEFLKQLEASIRDFPGNTNSLVLALAAQWLYELRNVFALHPRPAAGVRTHSFSDDPVLDLALTAEVANYAAFRNDGQELERRGALALESQRSQFETVLLEGEQAINRLNKNIIDLQSKDEELRAKIGGYEETLVNQIKRGATADTTMSSLEERIVASDENVQKFTEAIERKFAMSATRNYWEQQATRASCTFWISVGVLAVLLVLVPLALIIWHTAVLGALQDILVTPSSTLSPDMTWAQLTVASINRLILLILPVALLIWFVRLIVRFTNRSLALMDDAELRQAMMDTFLRLDVDSELSKEERNVMLNALYRPGPGQSPDAPDFPNVIELINKLPVKP